MNPVPPSQPTDDPRATALAWRLELERAYGPAAERLLAAYGRVRGVLAGQARALAREIAAIESGGGSVSPAVLRRLASYQALAERIEADIGDFAALARFESGALADEAVRLGVEAALDGVAVQSALAAAAWASPDPALISALVGYVDSDGMRAKFASFGANAAQDFADLMLALTAQGKGSRAIARALTAWLDVPFAWAENLTRTTQIYSYRAATSASFAANAQLLDGWLWEASLDGRTCLSCISQHGTIHSVDETLDDHWRGRCVQVPVVKGTTWASDVERGQDWFERLPEGVQRRLAGDLLWTSLRAGDIGWGQLSQVHHDDVFGSMRREASVRELVPDDGRYAALQAQARGLTPNGITRETAAIEAARARSG